MIYVEEKAKCKVKYVRKAPGLAKKKAFYWKKRRKKKEGERYGSIYAILFNFTDSRYLSI